MCGHRWRLGLSVTPGERSVGRAGARSRMPIIPTGIYFKKPLDNDIRLGIINLVRCQRSGIQPDGHLGRARLSDLF
jgi:hypothetical protein